MTSATACHDLDQLLSAYVDHEASPDEMRLVEEHTRECEACLRRLRRMQRLAPKLDLDVQALLSSAGNATRPWNAPARPPELMLARPPSPPLVARFSTMAVLLVFALLAGVLLHSGPPRTLQTGAQPGAVPLTGPIVAVSIDGLVDPPTASYVHRAILEAERQNATVVASLDPSGGLDPSVAAVEQDFAAASIPTYAYLRTSQNPTTVSLAAATDGTIAAMPAGASISWMSMDFGEALWHRVLDPSTAYVFFVLGLYAVFVEIAHPGSLVPGITGVVSMAIAAVAFSTLPTNWLGVVALVAGVALMAAELKAAKHGLLMLCGVIFLAAGSLALYGTPLSGVVVAPVILLGVVLAGLILSVFLVGLAQRIHRLPPLGGFEHLVGARGVARSELSPNGVVHVQGHTWSAHARGGTVAAGDEVRVLARRGLVLDVESASFHAAATQKGAL